jgi:hypothetical protein
MVPSANRKMLPCHAQADEADHPVTENLPRDVLHQLEKP